MGKETSDNYEPSADDLANAERLFRDIGSENVLSDAENLDIVHERVTVDRDLVKEMRAEMMNRLFDISDLLETSPDFPERKAARFALKAACRLLEPWMYGQNPAGRAKIARDELENALSALKEFDPKAKEEEEAF